VEVKGEASAIKVKNHPKETGGEKFGIETCIKGSAGAADSRRMNNGMTNDLISREKKKLQSPWRK